MKPRARAYPFDPRKATQAAAYMLSVRGGEMFHLELVKLLYLADREAITRWGHPITTSAYCSMDHGPVPSDIYDMIKRDPEVEFSLWNESISERIDHRVHLLSHPGVDALSDAEIELLRDTSKNFQDVDRWELVKLTHHFPEWEDPENSSIPIPFSSILNALGKSPEEVQAIEHEARGIDALDRILLGGVERDS